MINHDKRSLVIMGFAILLLTMLISISISGCTQPSASEINLPKNATVDRQSTNASVIDKLTIGTVATLNTVSIGDMGVYYSRNTMSIESLVGQSPDGTWVSRLADSWETPDSKTWTFHLNKSARWHDGEPFTSKDVNFTIYYTLNKLIWIQDSMFIYDIESVKLPDDHTVVITLKKPDSNMLSNIKIGLKVLPEHIYKNVSDPMKYAENNATVGTGPYLFESLDKDAGVLKYRANENYYRGKPVIDEIVFKYYSNADTMIMALQKDDIDTTFAWGSGIEYYYVPSVLKDDNLKLITAGSGSIRALSFNGQQAPFSNKTMREAISYAIDYEELKNICIGGYGDTPNSGIVPPSVPNYKDTRTLSKNLTLANKLLNDTGYIDRNGDGFREAPDGSKFKPLLITSSTVSWTRPAELLKKYLNDVGIDVQVKVVSSNWRQEQLKREYGMMLGGTSIAGTYAYAGYGTTMIDAKGGLGNSNVNDSVLDARILQIRSATTPAQQRDAGYAIQDYYDSNLPALPIYWFDIIQPYNRKYEGYQLDPWFGILSYDTFFGLKRAG